MFGYLTETFSKKYICLKYLIILHCVDKHIKFWKYIPIFIYMLRPLKIY